MPIVNMKQPNNETYIFAYFMQIWVFDFLFEGGRFELYYTNTCIFCILEQRNRFPGATLTGKHTLLSFCPRVSPNLPCFTYTPRLKLSSKWQTPSSSSNPCSSGSLLLCTSTRLPKITKNGPRESSPTNRTFHCRPFRALSSYRQ